jgi:O-antigen/teichoic acid export membrane protein
MTDSVQDTDRAIARGAGVNVLGTIGKALLPVFFILIGRLYGAENLGIFYMAYVFLEIVASLTVSGINDGVLMFASRVVDDPEKEDELYRVFANGFVITLLISALLIAVSQFGGPALITRYYDNAELLPALQLMILSLPFMVVTIVIIAATKSKIIMKWEAILQGFLRPALLLGMATVGYFIAPTIQTLAWCYLLTWIGLALVSLWVFSRHFSYAKLARQLARFRLSGAMIGFAIPQNLNMTFSTFITNVDVMMLGYFGFKAELIGFYGMGAQIVRNVRQVKLAFSGAYAPVIARLHAKNDTDAMNASFSMLSRWTTTLALPIAFSVVFFRQELIQLFHGSFTGDTTFMLWILIPPLLSCSVGFSGNIIVMTGHSLWNLINSVSVAGLNVLFNYWLIPDHGLEGAAVATALAALIFSVAQLVEARMLVGARLLVGQIYKPWLAAVPATLIAVGITYWMGDAGVVIRSGAFAVAVLSYLLVLNGMGIEAKDRDIFFNRRKPPENTD